MSTTCQFSPRASDAHSPPGARMISSCLRPHRPHRSQSRREARTLVQRGPGGLSVEGSPTRGPAERPAVGAKEARGTRGWPGRQRVIGSRRECASALRIECKLGRLPRIHVSAIPPRVFFARAVRGRSGLTTAHDSSLRGFDRPPEPGPLRRAGWPLGRGFRSTAQDGTVGAAPAPPAARPTRAARRACR